MEDEWFLICFNPWKRSEMNSRTGEIRIIKFGHFKDKEDVWHRVEYFDGNEVAKIIKLENKDADQKTFD